MAISASPWWKEAVIYQVYPASFKDSNGDGIGDLKGLLSKIEYIQSTGADTIWICPMYDSPQNDMGYDISDYERVYPPYGTTQDMEAIIDECHNRGMKVILDLVINHTSDEHAWFQESRASKDSTKRDWYIWRPARYDTNGNRCPPNNWASFFGGSAWQWDDTTEEYYLHCFCVGQPDLNWENSETRKAIYETSMHFWLRKGIDGFRVDVVNLYSKPPGLPDATITDPKTDFQMPLDLVCNGPRIHEFLGEMNAVLAQNEGKMTVGELPNVHTRDHVLQYVSAKARQLSMVFQFDVVFVGAPDPVSSRRYEQEVENTFKASDMARAIQATQDLLDGSDGWVTTFLENHDQARSVSRWGCDSDERSRVCSAKMLAMMQTTLSGTLFLYQGQEIGMVNMPKQWGIEDYKDLSSINYYEAVKNRDSDSSEALAKTMTGLQHLARDNARVPFSWSAEKGAGFTTSEKPWMRIHDNYKEVNAERQINDPHSVLSFWKFMLSLRKNYRDVFVHGTFHPVEDRHQAIVMYEKRGRQDKALVALNLSSENQEISLPKWIGGQSTKILAATYEDQVDGILRPFEGRIWLGGRSGKPDEATINGHGSN